MLLSLCDRSIFLACSARVSTQSCALGPYSLLNSYTEAGMLDSRNTFTGRDRFMQQLFQDSMYLVTYFDKPDLFITFTANPAWEEIINALFDGQIPSDRPDIVARMFRAKLKDLIQNIKNGQIFGECQVMVYTVEYQKRGLSHAHIIVFLNSGHAFSESDQIDNIIRAEFLDRQLDPDGSLTEIVKQVMVHGLCGPFKPNTICMKKNHENGPLTCSKRFPKDFNEEIIVSKDGYPEYRRRRMVDGTEVTWKNGEIYDNR